jgi:hypothetical protein
MAAQPVVLLTSDGDLCRIAASFLAARFPGLRVIVEGRVSRASLLRRRVKRLGLIQVIGQMAFWLFAKLLHRASQRRIDNILQLRCLDPRWPDGLDLLKVPSVNSPECQAHLRRLQPFVVLVVGTRIIDRKTLSSIPAPFVNYHDGITPKYRGIRGGYWAKAEGDLANFGVTAHLVDPGIDTGGVLYQARLAPTADDNYATFPYLQIAAALPLLEQAARDTAASTLTPQTIDLPSQLWSHPTIWDYVRAGLRRGAW